MTAPYDIEQMVKTLTEMDRLAMRAKLLCDIEMAPDIFFDFAPSTGTRIRNDRRRGPFFVWGNLRVEPARVEYEYSKNRFL